jgi:Domain of unknown function (DUF427)
MSERAAAYPRPPALLPCRRHVRVEALGRLPADTHRCLRVIKTFHPPTFYLPSDALDLSLLEPTEGRSFCEWKGIARYFVVVAAGLTESRGGRGGRSGNNPIPPMCSVNWPAGIPSIPAPLRAAAWTAKLCCPSPVASMPAGSRAMLKVHSRGIRSIRSWSKGGWGCFSSAVRRLHPAPTRPAWVWVCAAEAQYRQLQGPPHRGELGGPWPISS